MKPIGNLFVALGTLALGFFINLLSCLNQKPYLDWRSLAKGIQQRLLLAVKLLRSFKTDRSLTRTKIIVNSINLSNNC